MTTTLRKFPFPTNLPSWFVGHMRKALGVMDVKINSVDLFVEVRDARLPLSSINPRLTLYGKQAHRARRLVVYCKRDLGDRRFEEPLRNAFRSMNDDTIMFADTLNDSDVRLVFREIIRMSVSTKIHTAISDGSPIAVNVMIAGMPNVGKSSLLNALRRVGLNKAKAAFTGSHAGVTRKVTGNVKICENPLVYIFDTPGIMIEYFGKGDSASERALNLALSGGIKDHLFDLETLAGYLLWRIECRFYAKGCSEQDIPPGLQHYSSILPSEDSEIFFTALAKRIGALLAGGAPDLPRTMRFFIESFRKGKLGSWSLDDLTFTGPMYARLEDGRDLFVQHALPLPAPGISVSPQKTAEPSLITTMSLIPPLETGINALEVSQDMPLQRRVELAVSTRLNTEMHNFLHPTTGSMSNNRMRTAAKAERLVKQREKYKAKRLHRRPDFLYSTQDRRTRLRRRNKKK